MRKEVIIHDREVMSKSEEEATMHVQGKMREAGFVEDVAVKWERNWMKATTTYIQEDQDDES